MKFSFRTHPYTFIAIYGVIVLFIVAAFGLYTAMYRLHSEAPIVRSVASVLPLPAAKVGGEIVTYKDYLTHVDALRRYMSGPAAAANGLGPEPTEADLSAALDRAIRIKAVQEIANEQNVAVTSVDVERTYSEMVAKAGTSTTPGEIEAFINDEFGWSVADFKRYILQPALMEDTLKLQMQTESGSATAFDDALAQKLSEENVKRYLTFSP